MPPRFRHAADYEGIPHAKLIRVGGVVIVGSTNWTTSSRCNWEADVALQLNQDGGAAFNAWFAGLESRAEVLDVRHTTAAENQLRQKALDAEAAARTRAATRSSSSPQIG